MKKVKKYLTAGKLPESSTQVTVPSTGYTTPGININTGNFYGGFGNTLASTLFGGSNPGNINLGLLGSYIGSAFQNNGNPLSDNSGNINSLIAGIGAGLIGNGIESLGGHSKSSKFLGGASSNALGTIGGSVLNGKLNFSNDISKIGAINPWGFGMSVVGSGLLAMNGPSKEYGGKYGSVTKTMDTIYDGLTAGVSMLPGGLVASGAMVLNKGLSNLFGSTDGMTMQDAILGSAFMPAPVKWLNMAGAKKTGTFDDYSWQNREKTAGILGSYGNLESKIDKAMNEAGKTYGTFSRNARKRALNNLNFANMAWGKLTDMADLSELLMVRSSSMDTVNTGRYAQNIQGGLLPYYRGKNGMKFPKLLEGGYITDLRKRIRTIANNSNSGGRNLADLITYAEQVNPRFIQRLQEPALRYISEGEKGIKSHKLSYTTVGDNKAIVYPLIQEGPLGDLFEIKDPENAYERALQTGDYLEMTPQEAELFTTEYKTYKPWKDLIDRAIEENENNAQLYRNTLEQQFLSPYEQFFLRVYKDGGTLKKKKRIKLVGEGFEEGEYIEVDSLDSDLKAGRKPIGKDKKGRDIFLNGDGNGVLNQHGKQTLYEYKNGGIVGKQKIKLEDGSYLIVNNLTEDQLKGRKPIGKYKGVDQYMKGDGTAGPSYNGKLIPSNLEGGIIDSEEIEAFRKGGSMNVIPEGALHARKHHMTDSEKLTLKGIPVVDNDGRQQAEIECNEIIFRKEVTDKIEQLRKKFKEASNSEKDDIAIQCGKILTKEIINNTEDRTGLLKIVEDGMDMATVS